MVLFLNLLTGKGLPWVTAVWIHESEPVSSYDCFVKPCLIIFHKARKSERLLFMTKGN